MGVTTGIFQVVFLLAQSGNSSKPFPAWKPFLTPMPIWDYWFWLLIPLSLGVALAYKSTKVAEVRTIPREGLYLAVWIIGGLIAAAAAVAIVARLA
jgi:hypothetical protein